jgi:hypothetical protein
VNAIVIPRNTVIPTQAARVFKTAVDGQRSVAVPVVEGESERPEFCVPLGKCVVRDLPPGLARGTPVEVEFRYAANGRLSVSATVPGTGHSARVDIERRHADVEGDLPYWRDRLLGRAVAISAAVPALPFASPAVEVDLHDRASVLKRLDALYIDLGRQAAAAAAPESAAASHRAARAAAEQAARCRARLAEAHRRHESAISRSESVQWGAEVSAAQLEWRQAETQSEFAYLVLGRECVEAGFCPAGGRQVVNEIDHLRRHID